MAKRQICFTFLISVIFLGGCALGLKHEVIGYDLGDGVPRKLLAAKTDNQDGLQQNYFRTFRCEKGEVESSVKECEPEGREHYATGSSTLTEIIRGPATSGVNNGLFGWFLSKLRPSESNITQNGGGASSSSEVGDVSAKGGTGVGGQGGTGLGGTGVGVGTGGAGGNSSAGASAGASSSSSSSATGVGVGTGGQGGHGGAGGSGGAGGAGGHGGAGGSHGGPGGGNHGGIGPKPGHTNHSGGGDGTNPGGHGNQGGFNNPGQGHGNK